MPETTSRKDFFISYTSVDASWAEWIAAELEHAGYTTIIQAWDFRPGSNFLSEMDNAIKVAERTIAVLSPKYFDSDYTFSEWAAAFQRDPKGEQGLLLPIRVQLCNVEGLLGPIVYIDLVNQDEQSARQRLLEGVHREPIRPTSVPFPSAQGSLPGYPPFPGALPKIWNIPYPRNPYFTGRKELLTQLATTLQTGQTTALSQPRAISGLGGIGKTQLALEYAYRYHQDYQAVFWIQADSREALMTGFVTIAELLSLPEKDMQEQMKAVVAVQQWLRTHTKWLLIFDNADDLAIVKEFIPTAIGGHLLLTTRAYAMGHLAQRIEVDNLSPELGALFLLKRTGLITPNTPLESILPTDAAWAKEISQEMGGLPLALDQAGAYIEEVSCTLSDYKQLYQTQRAYLLKERGELVTVHPESVTTTWSLSFKHVEQADPAAADLLRLCAFFHPDAIPEELITGGSSLLGPVLEKVVSNPLAFDKAIRILLSHSLLRRHQQEKILSIHRLVQVVLKDEMEEVMQQEWAERVIKIVGRAFPIAHDLDTLRQCQRLLPHALVSTDLSKHWGSIFPEVSYLLNGIASYFQTQGQVENAVPLYLQAIHVSEKVQGLNNSQIAAYLNNLAGTYLDLHQYKKAEGALTRAIEINKQIQGPMHPATIGSLTNLAHAYRMQKKYRKAEILFLQVLHMHEQELELDHAARASILHSIAIISTEQGEYKKAESHYQQAYQLWVQALGPVHPTVAYTLANLAGVYLQQDRDEEAATLYQQALSILKQQLGPQHLNTINTTRDYINLIWNKWKKRCSSHLV